jgi:hypothetical protein
MPVGFIISTLLRKMIEPGRVEGGLHKTTAEVGKNASRNGKNAAAYVVVTAAAASAASCALLAGIEIDHRGLLTIA